MTSLSTYILVSHGSRDYRHHISLKRLAHLVQQQLYQLNKSNESSPFPLQLPETETKQIISTTATIAKNSSSYWVETATLELAPYPLHEQIQRLAKQVRQAEGKLIKIIPLFLLKGVHVEEDIPKQVKIAQTILGNSLKLELCPCLGTYPQIKHLLAHQFSHLPATSRIVLSHGSRRPGANQLIEEIALQLSAKVAYWSVNPSLEDQIKVLANESRNIAILPYFLFKGAITDAIAQQVLSLQQSYPHLNLVFGEPLEATPELADIIINSYS